MNLPDQSGPALYSAMGEGSFSGAWEGHHTGWSHAPISNNGGGTWN